MQAFPKYIALTDFSENAPAVIRFAYYCSKAAGQELRVLHKSGMLISARLEQDVRRRLRNEDRLNTYRDLHAYIAEILPDTHHVKCEVITESLSSALKKLQIANAPNMVFSGMKITSPFKQRLVGSTPVRLTRLNNDFLIALHPFVKTELPTALVIDEEIANSGITSFRVLLKCLPSIRKIIFTSTKDNEYRAADGNIQNVIKELNDHYEVVLPVSSTEPVLISEDGLLVLSRKNSAGRNRFFSNSGLSRLMYKAERSIIILPEY